MTRSLPALFVVFAASLATPALAQSPLQVSVTVNGSSSNLPSGGAVSLTAGGIGQADDDRQRFLHRTDA